MLKVLIKYFMYLLSESLLTPRACYIMYTIVHYNVHHNTLEHVCTHRQSKSQLFKTLAVPKMNKIKIVRDWSLWQQCLSRGQISLNIQSVKPWLMEYNNMNLFFSLCSQQYITDETWQHIKVVIFEWIMLLI